MEECIEISIDDVIITLDNAPIHCSKNSKAWAAKIKLIFEWLSPYSPKLAPVEKVFGMTKTMISRKQNINCIDFSKKTGLDWLQNSLQDLTTIKLNSLYLYFINEAKLAIFSALEQAKNNDTLNNLDNKEENKKNLADKIIRRK